MVRWVEGDGERRRRRHFAALAAVCSMLGVFGMRWIVNNTCSETNKVQRLLNRSIIRCHYQC